MNFKSIFGYFLVGLIGGLGYELVLYSTSAQDFIDWPAVLFRVAVISITLALSIAFFRSVSKKDLGS